MDGVGNRIAHNQMHDAPHHAIRMEGNDHLIEFNEVDHVVQEADDQGGFDEWPIRPTGATSCATTSGTTSAAA